MINPANIFRSNRRTLSIQVDPKGDLVVHAPVNMTDRKIFDFIKSRQDWIEQRQAIVAKNSYINRNVATYNSFMFLGEEITPIISSSVKKITRQDKNLLIPAKIENEKILKKTEKFFKDNAKEIIIDRCMYFSQVLKLNYAGASPSNNKTRWGSCSRSGEITINWRAVMLKPCLLDYIIVHEFCHLLEFNHTKNFWAIVQTILPNWKALRTELKHMGWLLQLFRN